MQPDVADWFARRMWRSRQWTAADLVTAKGGTRISVVLPALDEERTVGDIVGALCADLVTRHQLVDELLVVDSGSRDRTAEVAAAAGARVVHAYEVLPDFDHRPGKGEVLWKSLAVTTGDVVVFLDSDLLEFSSSYVIGLLGPLLTDPTVQFVKAVYDRPLATTAGVHPTGGGRVTELVARPLLNLYWPQLAGFIQPLAGEYAARRDLLESLPFAGGYGVEIGLLIDTLNAVGLDAMGQVDLGVRAHAHQPDSALAVMAAELLQTVARRVPGWPPPQSPTLTTFARDDLTFATTTTLVPAGERPPMRETGGQPTSGGTSRA